MGETLPIPVKEKHTSLFETSFFTAACCGMQGWRKTMEDAHVAQLYLAGDPYSGLFGVYDGHNGYNVAKYCGTHMVDCVLDQPEFVSKNYGLAMAKAYLSIEQSLSRVPEYQEGGCTANTVIIADNRIICANTGDSRSILVRSDGTVISLSEDHKPTKQSEADRIIEAGGRVEQGRVSGLALTRAIGDFAFKDDMTKALTDQAITCRPDIVDLNMASCVDRFVIIACDGVWDVMTREQCAQFVMSKIKELDGDLGLVCEALLDECCAKNINIIIDGGSGNNGKSSRDYNNPDNYHENDKGYYNDDYYYNSGNAQGVGTDNMTVIVVEIKEGYWMGRE